MRNVFAPSLLAAVGWGIAASSAAADTFHQIDLTPFANFRIQTLLQPAATFPDGPVSYHSVPFSRPASGTNAWSAWYEINGAMEGLRTLEISPRVYGATSVYFLLNTMGGEQRPGTFASIQFFGSEGAYYQKPLDGNVDVRDYLYGDYTNTINGTTTVNAFSSGPPLLYKQVRLDMQRVDLPAAFANQSLSMVQLIDAGGTVHGVLKQRLILSGVTIAAHATPEPGSLAALCSLAACWLAYAARRSLQ